MRALGNYMMRGRGHAIAVISLLTMLSLLLPPFTYVLSGAPVALVSLRRGAVIGMQVILGSLAVIAVLCYPAGINPVLAPAFGVSVWLPVWLCAGALRLSASQAVLVMTAGGLGGLFVLFMRLLVHDVTGWWRSWFAAWGKDYLPADAAARYQAVLDTAMPMMNAMMASGLVVSLILTLLLARWWQSLLFNPGAFREEFHALRLPRAMLGVVVAVTVLSLAPLGLDPALFRDLLVILVFLYLFQGVAAVHRTVHQRGWSAGWLAGMYLMLLLLPQMVLFIACIGLADAWLGGPKPGS